MIGETVLHYTIIDKLGEGGMGVVYKARDTKLDRIVALKFLPQHLNASDQDRARFIQEAKAAATLSHPNICTIYGIEEISGSRGDRQVFIVMEFVDGQTLQEKKGTLSLKQAIEIGIQMADGLSAAHEKGIVHRDIKPENIMIRKDGIVQIMDFGLAKLRARGSKISRLTKEGSTVGTAGYMSPEQVQGQETDHRSDIFSFGVVLYEMLTGQLPFKGVHETALAYEIVNIDPPPMASIDQKIDPSLDAIIFECLEKDPRERTQSIAQVSVDLKRYRRESSRQRASRITATRPTVGMPAYQKRTNVAAGLWRKNLGYISAGILAIVAIFLIVILWKEGDKTAHPVLRLSIELPAANPLFWSLSQSGIAVSPDGKYLAYTGQIPNTSQLFLHRMDQLTSEPIPGTENGAEPVFSPDGQWIAFNASQAELVKISVFGGEPEILCRTNGQTRGICWAEDNSIYYGHISSSIYRVPAQGGTPIPVTTLDSSTGEISHRFPQILPDGKTIIFTVKNNNITSFDDATIVAQRLGSGERKILVRGGTYARYLPNGFLVYMRGNAIYAIAFDAERLEVKGPPVLIEEGGYLNPGSGQGNIGFSNNGILVFARAGPLSYNRFTLKWMDRQGYIRNLLDSLRSYFTASISPDGQQIATDINAANDDIWLYQISRGTLSRVTFADGNNNYPLWSPDGKYVVYSAEKGKARNIFRKPWDGSGIEERLTNNPNPQIPRSLTPDGKTLSFDQNGDIWILPLEGDRKPYPFVHSPANEEDGLFSPDGRWLAYTSNQSGHDEIYVTGFPKKDRNWQVSTGGGIKPIWSRNGKELFFTNGSSLMVVTVSAGSAFDFSVPRKLCDIPPSALVWDVTPDGKRFLVRVTQVQAMTLSRLEVVTEWFERVRDKIVATKN